VHVIARRKTVVATGGQPGIAWPFSVIDRVPPFNSGNRTALRTTLAPTAAGFGVAWT